MKGVGYWWNIIFWKVKNPQSKICLDCKHKLQNWHVLKWKPAVVLLILSPPAVRLDAADSLVLICLTVEFYRSAVLECVCAVGIPQVVSHAVKNTDSDSICTARKMKFFSVHGVISSRTLYYWSDEWIRDVWLEVRPFFSCIVWAKVLFYYYPADNRSASVQSAAGHHGWHQGCICSSFHTLIKAKKKKRWWLSCRYICSFLQKGGKMCLRWPAARSLFTTK